jgi:hypothetical protein
MSYELMGSVDIALEGLHGSSVLRAHGAVEALVHVLVGVNRSGRSSNLGEEGEHLQ